MTGIKRNLYDKAIKLLGQFPVLVILGARQAGKTSLAKQIAPNWNYFDLEKPKDLDRISFDADFFFQQFPEQIIIDEAQEHPELFQVLRGVVDQKRDLKGRFILTGSSSPEILRDVSESLAGRVAILELGTLKANEFYQQPLSSFYNLFNEKLDKENLPKSKSPLTREQMQKIWLKGGYPEPLINGNEEFYQLWMENYRNTYIDRDIAKLFPRLNRLAYRRFLQILSQLSGTIINKSDIARSLEVSEASTREYLTIAEGTFLWRQLTSYEKSIEKAVIKMPKGYLRDSGLLHYLLKIVTQEDLYHHLHVSRSFESFVIEEICKGLNALMVTNWQPHYYRTRNKAEIDLILDGPFGILPIEIKLGSTVQRRNLMTLQDFIQKNNLPFGLVINQAEEVLWLTDTILQIPFNWL